MRTRTWILVPLALAAVGCDKSSETATPAPSQTDAPPPPPEAKPKRQPAQDLQTKRLIDELKCGPKSENVCVVLSAFQDAKAWDLTTIQSAEARYFGKGWQRKGDKTEEQWVFLVVKKVPLNEVQEGDVPVKIALRTFADAPDSAKAHADKLLRLLERDNAVNKFNNAAEHVKTYAPSQWDGAAPTQGASTVLFVGAGAFLRQGKGRSLHVVQLQAGTPGANVGDGLFATLYPLSW